MLSKWVKILFLFSLAVISIILMIRYLDVTTAPFSFGFNFALMFWFAILEFQLKPALDSPYFDPWPFEKQGKLYRILGVEWYRTILTKSGWEKVRQQQTPIKKGIDSFEAYERATRVAESGHLIVAIIVLIVTGYVLFAYSLRDTRWLILFNVLLNIYPVLLQRYTRPRLRRMIERLRAVEIARNRLY
ncbi:hypothetical protein SAMN05660293_05697 [Dyadobacter psychrophilus]|uniref:Glycosyl-4,4'-diaponeurosporenoate acyltransferase n=2 Tax=Dyadobacter psychrophilus TaxID=651661 RepID=A0A1T5HJ01_9BACT|nr:hypothetical protein SAMN05660293_05697 [Dyadobacter psychrophilus]